MEDKTTYKNPFLQADEVVKEAVKEAVQNLLEEKGMNTYVLKKNPNLWKTLDLGISRTTYYGMIGTPQKPKDEPSRRAYIKVCRRLGIKLDEGRHPLTLA